MTDPPVVNRQTESSADTAPAVAAVTPSTVVKYWHHLTAPGSLIELLINTNAIDNTSGSLLQSVMQEAPKLLDQVRNLIRLKHMRYKAERAYVAYIRAYIIYQPKRHPREMAVEQIRDDLSHLAVEKNVAA